MPYRLIQSAVRALWLFVLPLLLAADTMKYLVPRAGLGLEGLLARIGNSVPVLFFAGLFLGFALLAHYWRFRLPGGAFAAATAADETKSRASTLRRSLGTALALAGALGAALAMRAFLGQPYQVLNGSMMPTLELGDRVATDKVSYRWRRDRLPARGDAIVFESASVPLGGGNWPADLVKRVVGLPGDTIEMRGETPVINGWAVPSCVAGRYVYMLPTGDAVQGQLHVEFLDDRTFVALYSAGMPPMQQPYVVRPGEVFVVGDNRGKSFDSRYWNQGRGAGVPVGAIEGWVRWFLVGKHRSGDADFSRLFRPLDMPPSQARIEGVDASELEAGVSRCLRERPANTRPPPPLSQTVASTGVLK